MKNLLQLPCPPQEALPTAIGKLFNLEELVVSQNFIRALPPSVGLCRRLHTLNVDENDLDALPKAPCIYDVRKRRWTC